MHYNMLLIWQMKYLLERLRYSYNDLKDKNEIAIYNKYGNIGKRITFAFIGKKRIIIFYYFDFITFNVNLKQIML